MKKRYFYYGVLARTHEPCCNSVRIQFDEPTLQEDEWRFTVDCLRNRNLESLNIACVAAASAFVALLTRGRYHVQIRFYEREIKDE